MNILFVHQSFPGQFINAVLALAAQPGNRVVFLTQEGSKLDLPQVQKVTFKQARYAAESTHPYLRNAENAVLQGQAAYRAGLALKQQGFVPDVIYGHAGFGATMYMKDLYPHVPLVGYFEWFYHAHGTDMGFDPAEPTTMDDECRLRTKNMVLLQELASCDAGVTPTYWQHSQFPLEYRTKLMVLHDGVDTRVNQPVEGAKLVLPEIGLDLSEAQEIVTYVGRGMEPYRGFPQFMEAVSLLLKERPQCHVVVVGSDEIAYGHAHASGKSYKTLMLESYSYDQSRLHFTGPLVYGQYRQVLQASSVHVYLTYPFVLSWSMLEAMACGCTLVGSATPPVQEVVRHGENGMLVDFFNAHQLAKQISELLDQPEQRKKLGMQARETIKQQYDSERLLGQQLQLLTRMAQKR
ncbi:MAG: glycosyltransferase family 4 protein [Anaeromusa sp.]|uniref:glycosyltransferase family 4 protein n=1 Tax=Anaeromusa sp. TaxID=1872520 RepID=UPI002B21E454|nr:glycosyltransferase family 4 protein [Anaeromusa sp.]MEA4836639.1 glycosyltransferase family 4 protein [Anaeromusa sp.]